MSIQAIITLFFIVWGICMFAQFAIGYLLGWRAGHLTGIEYAMKIWLSGAYIPPASKDVAEYTAEVIKTNGKRLQSVKDETKQQIEELRKSGIK